MNKNNANESNKKTISKISNEIFSPNNVTITNNTRSDNTIKNIKITDHNTITTNLTFGKNKGEKK
jgi:hypothetical protein